MSKLPKIDDVWEWAKIAFGIVSIIAIGWLCFEYIFPKHASWRSVCDAGYYQYVPVTNCTNGNCSTTTEAHWICTHSHWVCRKGRDGSTRCEEPRPGDDY